MAYTFDPLAIPNTAAALLTLLMFYLLMRFAPRTRVIRLLGIYVLAAALASLTWALLLLSDEGTAGPWRVLNSFCMVVIFPAQIHFLLIYMERGKWFTESPFLPAVLYAPALFQLILVGYRWLFELIWFVWIILLGLVLGVSADAVLKEKNPIVKAQKRLVMVFLVLPFLWLSLYWILNPVAPATITWTAGFFMAASAAIALYAMLRFGALNTKIVLRGGLVTFVASIIMGSAFLLAHRLITILFNMPTTQEAELLAFFIVIAVSWFFVPLSGAATRFLEWLAPDLKWKECRLKHVFLVHHTGVRIASAQSTELGVDADLAGGMLSALQDFTRDAFHAEEKAMVQTITVGKFKILVEKAPLVFLAIVFTGDEAPALREDVRSILAAVMEKHGEKLKNWDGKLSGFEDVQEMLEGLLKKAASPRMDRQAI